MIFTMFWKKQKLTEFDVGVHYTSLAREFSAVHCLLLLVTVEVLPDKRAKKFQKRTIIVNTSLLVEIISDFS